jgi:hypothetical protein
MMRFLAVLLLCIPTVSSADLPVPDHGCQAPQRPADDVDEQTWNRFLAGVDGYRACISAFVAANHDAADAHSAAANAATQAWNEFVRDSLNVPEDFPWPPE